MRVPRPGGLVTAKVPPIASTRSRRPSSPESALSTVERFDKLSQTLWDEEGKKRALQLQVQPLQLPPLAGNSFITMAYLRCGRTAAFGFNQAPSPGATRP